MLRSDTTYPGASPHAHLRHTWSVMVEAASRFQTELAFQTWLAKTDHRAFTYKSETLAGLLSSQYTIKPCTGQKSACLGKHNRISLLVVPWGLTLLLIGPPVGVVPSTIYLKNPGARSAPAPWLALLGRNASLSSIFSRTVTLWLPMPSSLQQLLTPW